MPGLSPGMMTPSPAAAPSANLGAAAHAAGQIKNALIMLETALPNVPMESPLHAAVRTSINALAKHLPAGGGPQSEGLQSSMMRDLALRHQQTSPMIAAMQSRGPSGAPAGQPGALTTGA